MVNVAEYTMRRSNRGLISKYSHTESSLRILTFQLHMGHLGHTSGGSSKMLRDASDIFQRKTDICTMIIMYTIDNVTCMYNIAKRIYIYVCIYANIYV